MRIHLGIPAWLLRAAARMLLVALSVAALGPVTHGVHEDDCDPVVVAHDETQHHVQAAPGDASVPADHCVACHFARSSRNPASWQYTSDRTPDPGILLASVDGALHPTPSAAPVPARAPPSRA